MSIISRKPNLTQKATEISHHTFDSEDDEGDSAECARDDEVDAGPPEDGVARWQNLIPSFPWIVPGWRVGGQNPRKGRDQILQRSVAEP